MSLGLTSLALLALCCHGFVVHAETEVYMKNVTPYGVSALVYTENDGFKNYELITGMGSEDGRGVSTPLLTLDRSSNANVCIQFMNDQLREDWAEAGVSAGDAAEKIEELLSATGSRGSLQSFFPGSLVISNTVSGLLSVSTLSVGMVGTRCNQLKMSEVEENLFTDRNTHRWPEDWDVYPFSRLVVNGEYRMKMASTLVGHDDIQFKLTRESLFGDSDESSKFVHALDHPFIRKYHNVHMQHLIDGDNYYKNFGAAVEAAEQEIILAGWKTMPETVILGHDAEDFSKGKNLLTLLSEAVDRGVRVLVLFWNAPHVPLKGDLLKHRAFESILKFRKEGIHCILDDGLTSPLSYSQHQKVAVIDGKISYMGGLDFAFSRWDVQGHQLNSKVEPRVTSARIDEKTMEEQWMWHDVHLRMDSRDMGESVRYNFLQRIYAACQNLMEQSRHCLSDVESIVKGYSRTSCVWAARKIRPGVVRDTGFGKGRVARSKALGVDDTGIHYGSGARLLKSKKARSSTLEEFGTSSLRERLRSQRLSKLPDYVHDKDLERQSQSRPREAEDVLPRDSTNAMCRLIRSMPAWTGVDSAENTIYESVIELIGKAQDFIYIEQQYVVSKPAYDVMNSVGEAIVNRIEIAMKDSADFHVYIVIPRGPEEPEVIYNQAMTIHLHKESIMKKLESYRQHLMEQGIQVPEVEKFISFYHVFSIRDNGDGTYQNLQVFVHSKMIVVDDKYAIVGSANWNDRSYLGGDSELAALCTCDVEEYLSSAQSCHPIARMRYDLWKEHTGVHLMDWSSPKFAEIAKSNADILKKLFDFDPLKLEPTAEGVSAALNNSKSGKLSSKDKELLGSLQGQIAWYPPETWGTDESKFSKVYANFAAKLVGASKLPAH